MFIGHFAIGLAAKSAKPRISLGTYFIAAQFVDLLWPTLLLLGIEQVAIVPGITEVTPLNFIHYPVSHSMLMAFVWALGAFILYCGTKRDVWGGLLISACVVSHWLLDFTTHRPDLPLTLSESIKVGLGLWNSKPLTIVVELLLFTLALWLYTKRTKPKNRTGIYSFWSLILFLLIIYTTNMFGPPPPNVLAIAWAGQLQGLFILWAYWADRNRIVTVPNGISAGQVVNQ